MSGRRNGKSGLDLLGQRVARWRAEHGGRGVRWPEELWTAAVAAARIDGVGAVAEAVGIGRDRLAARLARADGGTTAEKTTAFVEVDARALSAPSGGGFGGGTILRFEAGDGKKLEVELGDGIGLDVVALAQAFWGRER